MIQIVIVQQKNLTLRFSPRMLQHVIYDIHSKSLATKYQLINYSYTAELPLF